MQFQTRTLLYVITVIGVALAISIPIYRWSTFDALSDAEQQLRTLKPRIVRLRDKTGLYCAKLDLSGTGAKDNHLAYVRILDPINEIDLTNTNVTDAGLEMLFGVNTARIRLNRNQFSQVVLDRLQQSLPNDSQIILID